MINLYKSHSKKQAVNTFAKKIVMRGLLLMGFMELAISTLAQGPIQNANVTSTNGLASVNYSYRNNVCPTDNLGTITINTINSNSNTNYTYRWLDNVSQITNTRNSLTYGTYEVEITEISSNIKDNVRITITSPPAISIQWGSLKKTKCSGDLNGETNISVSGGTPFTTGATYKYTWVKKGTTIPVIATTENFVGAAGSYTVRVEDANGCRKSEDYDIEDAPVFVVSPTIKVNNVEFGDLNGKITLNISGGTPMPAPNPYTYVWSYNNVVDPSKNGPTQSNLPSGVYKITITDANNCTNTQTVNILPLARFDVTGVSQNNKCSGTPNGIIDITVVGGILPYKLKWSDQASFAVDPDRTGLSAGTYTLTAQDNNGTGVIRTLPPFTITDPTLLTFTATSTNNICFADNNGKIDLTVSGGLEPYSYILDGGTPTAFTGTTFTVTGLSSGPHTITITDANNCIVSPVKNIIILPLKAIVFSSAPLITKVKCAANSGAIKVFIDGGEFPYKYSWSNNPTLNSDVNPNITTGSYTVTVTDSYGCTQILPAIFVAEDSPSVNISEDIVLHKDNKCFEENTGSATIKINTGTPPFTQKWTYEGNPIAAPTNVSLTPNQIIKINNFASGNYTLTIEDNTGCNSNILTIPILPLKKITSNPIITNITCKGNDDAFIEVNPTGGTPGYLCTWTSSNFIGVKVGTKIGPIAPGNYILSVEDSKRCKLSDTTIVINSATPIIVAESIFEKANICVDDHGNGSAKIKVKGGFPPYTKFEFFTIDSVAGLSVPVTPATVIDPNYPDIAINNKLLPGKYWLVVFDQNLCSSDSIPFKIVANNCNQVNDKLYADPLMSPNGDGVGNDFFYINKIEDYPENEVIIYNRWGMEVFNIKGYNNSDRVFSGIANSALTNKKEVLVDGVYYYSIRSVVDKKPRINKGYIIIKR